MKTPLYWLPLSFKFYHNPFFYLVSLNDRLYDVMFVLYDLMISQLSLCTQSCLDLVFVTEVPQCVVYSIKSQDRRKLKGFCKCSNISHTQPNTHREKYTDTYRETNSTTHIHKFILTPPIMCSQELLVLTQKMNESLISNHPPRQNIFQNSCPLQADQYHPQFVSFRQF